jgi:hypothetical protein
VFSLFWESNVDNYWLIVSTILEAKKKKAVLLYIGQ